MAPGDGGKDDDKEGDGQQPEIVVKIDSIDWKHIANLPAGLATSEELVVGRTVGNSTTETNKNTFKASFEVSAGFEAFGANKVSAKAMTSAGLDRMVATLNSATMTSQKSTTKSWDSSTENRKIWALTMIGVLLADSLSYGL